MDDELIDAECECCGLPEPMCDNNNEPLPWEAIGELT